MAHERGNRVWRAEPHHAWTYDFSHKRQRYSGSTHTQNKREAERVARCERSRVVEEWHREHPFGANKRIRPLDMSFAQAVAAYMDGRGDRETNRSETAKHLLMLCEPQWIGAATMCSEIDTTLIHQVVTARSRQPLMSRERKSKSGTVVPQMQVWTTGTDRPEKRPFVAGTDQEKDVIRLSAAYVNRSTIDLIKRVLRYVSDFHQIRLAPIAWKKLRLPEPEPTIIALAFEEEKRIDHYLTAADGYGDLARFAILTAMRLENFTGLLWQQIDFDRRTITLLQKGGNGRRKSHTIHMDDAILEVVKAQVGRHPKHVFVFTSKKTWTNPKNGVSYKMGKIYPITYWGFCTWWTGIQVATGLMHITPHAFRRTAASRLVRFSGSLIAAQKLLGHSDIRTTAKHYAQFTSDDALTAQRAVRIATKERLSDLQSTGDTSQTDHKRKSQAA